MSEATKYCLALLLGAVMGFILAVTQEAFTR